MNNEPYGWVKNGEYVLYIEKPDSVFNYIPLYTHQYERPHNTVLVPCDKLAEMKAEIETLKKDNKELHAIAQRMAMAESDARKSLQWFKEAQEK